MFSDFIHRITFCQFLAAEEASFSSLANYVNSETQHRVNRDLFKDISCYIRLRGFLPLICSLSTFNAPFLPFYHLMFHSISYKFILH